MNVVLFIDTSNNKEMVVGLKIGDREDIRKQILDTRKAQVVLPLTQQLLQEHKLQLKDLTAITVNPGPGSFTGVRVGIAIANTLGFLLKIPVNGKKAGEPVEAVYS